MSKSEVKKDLGRVLRMELLFDKTTTSPLKPFCVKSLATFTPNK